MAPLHDHIVQNYEAFVASGDRTYDGIAEQAEKDHAPELAAWARSRAAAAGDDITPTDATPEKTPYVERTIAELKILADDKQIDTSKLRLKDDFVNALEDHDKAANADGETPPATPAPSDAEAAALAAGAPASPGTEADALAADASASKE